MISGTVDDAGVNGGGVVYCFSGATGDLLYEVTSPAPFRLAYFGEYIVGINDVDADGAGDFVVGSLFEEAVYVFSGAEGFLLRTIQSPILPSCHFGRGLARIPDLDADGVNDIAVGAACEGDMGRGRVHIFSRATGAHLRSLISPGEGDGTLRFGRVLAGVQDADGDGAGDVLAGDQSRNLNGSNSQTGGAVYLYSGATGELLHEILTPVPFPNPAFGEQVSGVPDLDGDGRGDFIVSGSQHQASLFSAGQVYVYSGATGKLIRTLTSPGEQMSGRFGYGLAGLPGADGDSLGEIFVGAWGETPPNRPTRTGRAYLFSGGTGALLRSFVSPVANRAHANFGTWLATVSDPTMRGGLSFASLANDCIPPCNHFDLRVGRAYIFRFCRADWNYDGVVDSRDFFRFLAAFFESRGDYNQDAATDSSDLFDFIDDFFAGCDA